MAHTTPSQTQEEMQSVVQSLYNLMTQTYKPSDELTDPSATHREATQLVNRLLALAEAEPTLTADLPQDIIQFVQEGRNPDIYTREFVEFTMRNNQQLKGKQDAFAAFRAVLAKEIVGALPELRTEVKAVVERTGGVWDG